MERGCQVDLAWFCAVVLQGFETEGNEDFASLQCLLDAGVNVNERCTRVFDCNNLRYGRKLGTELDKADESELELLLESFAMGGICFRALEFAVFVVNRLSLLTWLLQAGAKLNFDTFGSPILSCPTLPGIWSHTLAEKGAKPFETKLFQTKFDVTMLRILIEIDAKGGKLTRYMEKLAISSEICKWVLDKGGTRIAWFWIVFSLRRTPEAQQESLHYFFKCMIDAGIDLDMLARVDELELFNTVAISLGAEISESNDMRSVGGFSALQVCSEKCLNLVKVLLEHGADVNLANGLGYSPLMWACGSGRKDIAELLVSFGADVNAVTLESVSPLGLAICSRSLELVKFLVEKGADVKQVNVTKYGFKNISENEDIEMLRFLMEKGADVKSSWFMSVVLFLVSEHIDDSGDAMLKTVMMVSTFIGAGVDLNMPFDCHKSVFDRFSEFENDSSDEFSSLAPLMIVIDGFASCGHYLTALDLAVVVGSSLLVEMLLQAGAHPNRDNVGCFALAYCQEAGSSHNEIATLLVRYGAVPFSKSELEKLEKLSESLDVPGGDNGDGDEKECVIF